MNKINIGADELILWLRKNGKAIGESNDCLGRKIYKLIVGSLEGKEIILKPCYWANENGDKNIGQFNLPKDATQYEIDINHLPALFNELMNW